MRVRMRHSIVLPLAAVLLLFAASSPVADISAVSAGSVVISRLEKQGEFNSIPGMDILAPKNGNVDERVLLTGIKARGIVTAAYAPPGASETMPRMLSQNRLILFGGFIEGAAHAAFGESSSDVSGNSLMIDDEHASIHGGEGFPYKLIASGGIGINARQNSLIMYAGEVRGDLAGGFGEKESSDNSVMLHGGVVTGSAYGGGTSTGKSFSNTVIMTGGKVEGSLVGGSSSGEGTASGNKVIFSGGKAGGIIGSLNETSPSTDNVIVLAGGEITTPGVRDKLGASRYAGVYGGKSLQSSATGNHIFLGGKTHINDCTFYGGASDAVSVPGNPGPDVISGNSLTLEEDYQGRFPRAQNFESVFLVGSDTRLPEKGYSFHPTVKRFTNHGSLKFSGKKPAYLYFSDTQYAGSQGTVHVYAYPKHNLADKIALDKGSLLLDPIRIRLENPDALPPGVPMTIVEIDHASSMREVNRRKAVEWLEVPSLGGEAGNRYVINLRLSLGGEDKDVWVIEKRVKRQKQK